MERLKGGAGWWYMHRDMHSRFATTHLVDGRKSTVSVGGLSSVGQGKVCR